MTKRIAKRHAPRYTDLHERVAALETLVQPLPGAIDQLRESLNKYKGAWGAITMIGSALVAFFTIFWSSIAKKFGWATP